MSDIRGIGLDLCQISRMETQLQHESFLNRVLTESERQYIESRGKMAAASLAAMWAAKEAAMKALSVGMAVPMTDIEISHLPSGQPIYDLHGKAAELACGGSMMLSITHEGDTAAAVCVWMG